MKNQSLKNRPMGRTSGYPSQLVGTILVLIIILYTVSLMVEKLRF